MTFAKVAERLARKENEYTERLNKSTSAAGRNTATRMLERVKNRQNMLREENRILAEPQGGMIPQFATGGEVYMDLIKKYFPEDQWDNAYRIMMGESGGDPNIPSTFNARGTEDSHGLFQINLQAHPHMKDKVLDPEENVKYAAELYRQSGWKPWVNTANKLGIPLDGSNSRGTSVTQRTAQKAATKAAEASPVAATAAAPEPAIAQPTVTANTVRSTQEPARTRVQFTQEEIDKAIRDSGLEGDGSILSRISPELGEWNQKNIQGPLNSARDWWMDNKPGFFKNTLVGQLLDIPQYQLDYATGNVEMTDRNGNPIQGGYAPAPGKRGFKRIVRGAAPGTAAGNAAKSVVVNRPQLAASPQVPGMKALPPFTPPPPGATPMLHNTRILEHFNYRTPNNLPAVSLGRTPAVRPGMQSMQPSGSVGNTGNPLRTIDIPQGQFGNMNIGIHRRRMVPGSIGAGIDSALHRWVNGGPGTNDSNDFEFSMWDASPDYSQWLPDSPLTADTQISGSQQMVTPRQVQLDPIADPTVTDELIAPDMTAPAAVTATAAAKPDMAGGAIKAAGMLGTFLDNFANRRAINNMQAPAAPTYTPGMKLNTTYDISPQLNAAREAETVLNRGIDNTTASSSTATAGKIGAFAERLRNTGQLYSQKQNVEGQLRNQETMMNADINMRNTATGNAYRQSMVDFNNAKRQAIAANTSNLGQDFMDIASDYQRNVLGPKAQLEVLKPLLNKYGMMDKYYMAWAEKNGIKI